jgi:tRNA threonylcarbamoyladenosine biosynthesis protein TsaB
MIPSRGGCSVKILAIETTELIGSVAAMLDGNMLVEIDLDHQQRSAQSLAPGIEALLRKVGWQPGEVELVAVTNGPGSFTGLRVGVATAKAFAYAVGAEVLGIDTLQTIAAGAPAEIKILSAVINAHRGEVVAQRFERDDQLRMRPTANAELLTVDAWLDGLTADVAVSGPVLRKLAVRVPAGPIVLEPHYWPPKAAIVAHLASQLYAEGHRDDLWSLAPKYYRRSAAEEKHDQQRRQQPE